MKLAFLLPELHRLQRAWPGHALWNWLGRADAKWTSTATSDFPQNFFEVIPEAFSVAAVSRLSDVGDAGMHVWLRADPCWLQPDMNALRMMAWGRMRLTQVQAEHLAVQLRPLFGDAGIELSIPHPDRWYLKLPAGSEPPQFAAPARVLGEDIEAHLPDGNSGLRWRRLLNEVQMSLHDHPVNQQRAQQGLAPVNSLWFWGAGRLPNRVRSDYANFFTDDPVIHGLAMRGELRAESLPSNVLTSIAGNTLVDLRDASADSISSSWIDWAHRALRARQVAQWTVHFADGPRFVLKSSYRWRFWRKALSTDSGSIR